jgi:hypothetical protein
MGTTYSGRTPPLVNRCQKRPGASEGAGGLGLANFVQLGSPTGDSVPAFCNHNAVSYREAGVVEDLVEVHEAIEVACTRHIEGKDFLAAHAEPDTERAPTEADLERATVDERAFPLARTGQAGEGKVCDSEPVQEFWRLVGHRERAAYSGRCKSVGRCSVVRALS